MRPTPRSQQPGGRAAGRPAPAGALPLALLLALAACTSLLPDDARDSDSPWRSYQEAADAFERIVPGKTTLAQLRALGLDPARSRNVGVLGHADLLRHLHPLVAFEGATLEPALEQCVAARLACFGYRIEQASTGRERVGGFWLDFLNFKRVTEVRGWQFDALVVINDGVVIYKSWSGKPNIHAVEREHHPLGPLQGLGSSLR